MQEEPKVGGAARAEIDPEVHESGAASSDFIDLRSRARESQPSAVVAVKGSLRQDPPRPSFWRRLSLLGPKSILPGATSDDRLLARLDSLSSQLESCSTRVRQLDERFTEVWEVEEQLSRLTELREMLEDMRERQGRVDGRLRGIERRLWFLALLAGIAAAAGLVGVSLAFL